MRFKLQEVLEHGQTRRVKKFAWLPVKSDCGNCIWMEYYYVNQYYHKGKYNWAGTVTTKGWKNTSVAMCD